MIGPRGDTYEREADRISRSVMSAAAPPMQRGCACGGGCPACRQGGSGAPVQTTPVTADGADARAAPPIVRDVLRSPGQPLDAATGAAMEVRFGHGFGHVRIHADAPAAESARAVNAQAYTVGPHIVFGAGRYAPGTPAGQRLLAHELSHVLQQRGAQRIQRAEPEGETPADPAVESAAPAPSTPVPAATPAGLRIGEVRHDPQGKPLAEPLTAEEKARLQALLDKLKMDDPAFHAAIENENVVVTAATLPEGNVGRHLLTVEQETRTMARLRWLVVELGGIDLSQGPLDMQSEAWKKGVELVQQKYPDQLEALSAQQETRPVRAAFSSVLMMDLAQIDAREKAYQEALEQGRSASRPAPPEKPRKSGKQPAVPASPVEPAPLPQPPQSALATLRHEAGHLLFERVIGYDKVGNALTKTTLPEPLASQVAEHSGDEEITTDVELLSEYAAEGVEQMNGPFDRAAFAEENDPRFGVGGYHDVDGDAQAPTGFGVRIATGLTLLGAKATARELGALGPVFLLTVPDPAAERRRFDVLMLSAPDEKTALDTFTRLKTDHPEVAKYEGSVVPY